MSVYFSHKQTQNPFYMPHKQMFQRAMILLIFTVVAVFSPTVHWSLTFTDHEHPLMQYTKLIHQEHFTAGWLDVH